MKLERRKFLATGSLGFGLGLSNAFAQSAGADRAEQPVGNGRRRKPIPNRTAKTTVLFKTPAGHPNALATQPDGLLWIGEQRDRASPGVTPTPEQLKPGRERAWLVDWKGKLLKTIETDGQNTSGMAFGDDCVWMCANAPPYGIYQTDMNSKTVSHRQIPLGTPENGGGCHGAVWNDDKLWVASLRLGGILRIDPKTWAPEFLIPVNLPEGQNRLHGITWDNGAIWMVTGNDSTSFATGKPGLAKYNAASGELIETVEFVPGAADPHGLAMNNGAIVSCDAGIHPGWPNNDSPFTGSIFRIDFL